MRQDGVSQQRTFNAWGELAVPKLPDSLATIETKRVFGTTSPRPPILGKRARAPRAACQPRGAGELAHAMAAG